MEIRKILKKEIKLAAKKFTEFFYEYKAYDYFISSENKFFKMYNMFLYELYPTYKFTYVFGDFEGLCVIQKPGDEDLKNCYKKDFIIQLLNIIPKDELEKIKEYINFAKAIAAKYFDKSKDCYVRNLGVNKECRGKGIAKKMIEILSNGKNIYLETHDKNNILIYEKMGFELVYEELFSENLIHYCLKKYSKN